MKEKTIGLLISSSVKSGFNAALKERFMTGNAGKAQLCAEWLCDSQSTEKDCCIEDFLNMNVCCVDGDEKTV